MPTFLLLLDNGTYVAVPTDKIQLRKEGPGVTTLGFTLDGKNEKQEPIQTFCSIVTFPVDMVVPAPIPTPEPTPVKKAKKAKR